MRNINTSQQDDVKITREHERRRGQKGPFSHALKSRIATPLFRAPWHRMHRDRTGYLWVGEVLGDLVGVRR
jgi:hypothetical protein